jgi:hypothetical protein
MNDFPTQPEQLSAAWLTQMLRQSGSLGADRDVESYTVAMIGEGIGLLGLVVRIALVYGPGADADAGAVGPESLVVKFAHPSAANRAIANNTRMYEREVNFFNSIAASVDVPKPRCFYAAVNAETGENIVVLEDLRGYRPADQVAGVDVAQARLIIDAFAPLHAAFWCNTAQPMLDSAMRIDSSYIEPFMPSILGTWERCLELFSSCIAPDVLVQIPRYIASMRSLHLAMGTHPQTLVHGDVRLDNVMMGTSVDQHPVVLIDWQAVMVSNAMHDLAYLLSQSLTIEMRRAHEDELVRHYHSRMVDLGVTDFTIEQCWAGYDAGVLFLFSYPLIIGGAFDPDNERGKQLAEEILRRSSQTVSDRQLFAMLP